MRDMEQGLLKTGQSRIATAVHDELLHEIANPLGAMTMTLFQASEMIDGLLNRVDGGDDSNLPKLKRDLLELREAHSDAIAAVEQLNALAARMRALPAVDPAAGVCDAGRVVDATVRILRRDVERIANIQVVLERAPLVRVETSALGQVVLNLVLNAAQAIEGSGLKGKTIRIVVESQGETAVLSVSDDGPGISKENLERIFEPYFTTKSTGTGLGLSIVREMVRRVGGQISVLSQPNHETTFRVLLPSAPSTA
jgi:signal transduction histidine kinase